MSNGTTNINLLQFKSEELIPDRMSISAGIMAHAAAGNHAAIRSMQKVGQLAQNGRTAEAKTLAKKLDHAANRASDAYSDICGPNPPRDFRRPIVYEDRSFSVAVAGSGNILDLTALSGGLNLNAVANQKFLQANDNPTAPGISMRAQTLGRRLVALGVDFYCLVQPSPAGNRGMPDQMMSNYITEELYKIGVGIFPTSSSTPIHDFTPAAYYRGGRQLLSGFETPVVDDNFLVKLVSPANTDFVGSTNFVDIEVTQATHVTIRCQVSAVFLYDLD